jgi:23S rRNA A2030 N6-methylase RlmJ
MSQHSQEPLREELEAAIVKVRHQIEIQQISDHYVGSGTISAQAIRELRVELAELEDALANLRPGDT